MFSQDRNQLRQAYLSAWRKACDGEPLQPVEQQIAEVARLHPEYQPLLEQDEIALGREWRPEGGETNPFLHMGLHIALREQLSIDQPAGIRQCYQAMLAHCHGDQHAAEHRIIECLAEALWKVQRDRQIFNPKAYLKCIKRRGGGRRSRA
jgi:hypothetical protein